MEGSKPDEITYEQFMHFLERKMVRYKESGLKFMLERCGNPAKGGVVPKKPIKMNKFVDSWSGLVLAPIKVTRTDTSGGSTLDRTIGGSFSGNIPS